MPQSSGIESVFLNIPYDGAFENLYLAYIVGPTQLGLRINATLAIPNQGRLKTISDLIEQSNIAIHDLSRIELSRGIPRFNMPEIRPRTLQIQSHRRPSQSLHIRKQTLLHTTLNQ